MTTIAYRDGIMAADSGAFGDDTYGGRVVKIVRTQVGGLVAFCGPISVCWQLALWMQYGGSGPDVARDDASGLLVESDGTVNFIDAKGLLAPVAGPYQASGSGRIAALGAMAAGASAQRAVEIACDLDAYTRGPVQVERLNPGGTPC